MCDTITIGNREEGINVVLKSDIKLWIPKSEELCYFWDEKNDKTCTIAKFKEIEYDYGDIVGYVTEEGTVFNHIAPFWGRTPPNIERNQE